MKCEHDNCLTCPYPDCISDVGPINRVRKKPGRKRMDPEEKKRRAKIYQAEYYKSHIPQHRLSTQKYYKKKRDEILEKQREYREKMGLVTGKRITSIWVHNGTISKRVSVDEYEKYLQNGWVRGRLLQPYKYKNTEDQ